MIEFKSTILLFPFPLFLCSFSSFSVFFWLNREFVVIPSYLPCWLMTGNFLPVLTSTILLTSAHLQYPSDHPPLAECCLMSQTPPGHSSGLGFLLFFIVPRYIILAGSRNPYSCFFGIFLIEVYLLFTLC